MTGPLVPAYSYLSLVTESTWGTLPGSPTYIHVPCDSYGVKFTAVNRQAQPYTGVMESMHNRNVKGWPAGQIPVRLFGWHPAGLTASPNKSLAEWLIDWAIGSQTIGDLPSKSAEWVRGPNIANFRDLGLRPAGATLSGSEDQALLLSVDAIGKDRVGQSVVTTGQTLPTDRKRLIEFLFEDCTFTLNSVDILCASFSWQIQRQMEVRCYNGKRPQVMRATRYIETFSITRPFEDDTWNDVLKTMDPTEESSLVLTMKGLHMGTGTGGTAWTQGVVTFPRLSLVTNEEQSGNLLDEQLNFKVLKPASSSSGHTIVWSDVS